ncbi:hypothetical protein [Streptomyces sp. SAI-218]|uniref:hypothetical protein n=1 Tax=Streptomyces sp. SAI-218 TaxID=3377736 RepID=UPI003C7BCCC5
MLDVVRRSDDVSGFEVLPRRWVVKKSLAWFLQSQRLVRDFERRPRHQRSRYPMVDNPVVHRQILHTGRVLTVRHRAPRSNQLPGRRSVGHHGGRLLLGQRLQILFQTDHPAPENLFRRRQVRLHSHQFDF